MPGTSRCPVHLLLGDRAMRDLLTELLSEDGWTVEQHSTLLGLWSAASETEGSVAVVDWSKTEGMLAEKNRDQRALLAQQVPIVVLVPAGWTRLLSAADLGVAALVPRPFDLSMLLDALHLAAGLARRDGEKPVLKMVPSVAPESDAVAPGSWSLIDTTAS